MKKSAHFRGHRSSTMLANVALASVLALSMSPAAKAMAAPNEADPQQPADQAQATVAANTAAGELKANIAATVNGGSMTSDKQFTFGLFETDDTGAKTGEAIATATVKAGQSAVLDGVFYDQDNAGETITYVISELGDLGDGWTKAADQKITVKVTDNGDGTMTADVAYEGGASAAAFDNKYEEPKTPEASKSKASSTTSTSKTTSTAKTGDPLTGVATICAGAAFASGAAALRARRMRENNR